MWCDNLAHNQGGLSQVTSPCKWFINNRSVTFERNPILFNCSQGFTRNFGISQPSWKSNAKNTKVFKQKVLQLAPVYPIHKVNLKFFWWVTWATILYAFFSIIKTRNERLFNERLFNLMKKMRKDYCWCIHH